MFYSANVLCAWVSNSFTLDGYNNLNRVENHDTLSSFSVFWNLCVNYEASCFFSVFEIVVDDSLRYQIHIFKCIMISNLMFVSIYCISRTWFVFKTWKRDEDELYRIGRMYKEHFYSLKDTILSQKGQWTIYNCFVVQTSFCLATFCLICLFSCPRW